MIIILLLLLLFTFFALRSAETLVMLGLVCGLKKVACALWVGDARPFLMTCRVEALALSASDGKCSVSGSHRSRRPGLMTAPPRPRPPQSGPTAAGASNGGEESPFIFGHCCTTSYRSQTNYINELY